MTGSFSQTLAQRFASLPPQLQKAARWITENPQDVALLSMRDQARRAGVQPATMTRLAQTLGLVGFEALRAQHVQALRRDDIGLVALAQRRLPLVADTPQAFAQAMLQRGATQLDHCATPETLSALEQAAELIAQARQIFCLGMRSSHAVAWHFYYALSLISERARFLDGPGGTGLDALVHGDSRDVLFVCGISPYTRSVIEAATAAHARGVHVVALTDSRLSPLAMDGACLLLVQTGSASFLHAMTPAFALADCLAALVARSDDPALLARLEGLDRELAARNIYLHEINRGSP